MRELRAAFVEIKGRIEHYGINFNMKKTSNSIQPINLGVAAKLKNKTYFNEFFRRRTQDEIAMQVLELRKRRKLTQAELAKLMGTGQSAVSRIESSDRSACTLTTFQRLAEALDARLVIRFEPREKVIANYERRLSKLGANRMGTAAINGDTNA